MADPRIVTQTLTIGFNTGTKGDSLIMEVDGRSSGLNNGRTSFKPGDDVYILLFKSNDVTIDNVISSKGTITLEGSESPQVIENEDVLVFANDREASVSKPIVGSYGLQWVGSDLGQLQLATDAISFTLAEEPPLAQRPYAGAALLTYNTEADVYRLTNTNIPDKEEYSIVIVAVGTAT